MMSQNLILTFLEREVNMEVQRKALLLEKCRKRLKIGFTGGHLIAALEFALFTISVTDIKCPVSHSDYSLYFRVSIEILKVCHYQD